MGTATTFIRSTAPLRPSPATILHRSPWHSPLPYLFGGLAAMVGLISFALLVLACSCWKHASVRSRRDMEKGDNAADAKVQPVFEEKVLVIMAGEVRPNCLATPKAIRLQMVEEEETDQQYERRPEESQ